MTKTTLAFGILIGIIIGFIIATLLFIYGFSVIGNSLHMQTNVSVTLNETRVAEMLNQSINSVSR